MIRAVQLPNWDDIMWQRKIHSYKLHLKIGTARPIYLILSFRFDMLIYQNLSLNFQIFISTVVHERALKNFLHFCQNKTRLQILKVDKVKAIK